MAKSKKSETEEKNVKLVESLADKSGKKSKLEALKERAKKLSEEKTSDLKEVKAGELAKKVKEKEGDEVEKADTLVPMDDYLKASIHLGTRVITPDMRKYVYRRRADGLAVFNTALLDDKIREGAEYLAKFAPKDVIIVCKREAGWHAVEQFAKATGIRMYTKKYPSGILTNPRLDTFTEAELVFICDPWLDKNALSDANRIKIPVLSVCDTNNFTAGIDKVIPGNNKSAKSLGMILHLLAKLYVEKRKLDVPVPPVQQFIEGWDNLLPPK